jgi:hypothetical protein
VQVRPELGVRTWADIGWSAGEQITDSEAFDVSASGEHCIDNA